MQRTHPIYPPKAQRAGIEGWGELEFEVTEEGHVESPKVRAYHPTPVFNIASIVAVHQWRYCPRDRFEVGVEPTAKIRLAFKLDPPPGFS